MQVYALIENGFVTGWCYTREFAQKVALGRTIKEMSAYDATSFYSTGLPV